MSETEITTRSPIESDVIPADSPYGQALLRRYDRETAEAEYRWKMGEIDGVFRRRQSDETAQRRRDAMDTDRFSFFNARFPLTTPGARTSIADLKKFDAEFLEGQLAKGHPLESLEREIAALQELHADNLAWWAEKEHKEARELAESQLEKFKADERLVNIVEDRVREIIREWALRGAPYGK